MVTSSALINAIIEGLKEHLEVQEHEILIYDCSRGIPDAYRKRVEYQVQYVEGTPTSLWRRIKRRTFEHNLTVPDPKKVINMGISVNDDGG